MNPISRSGVSVFAGLALASSAFAQFYPTVLWKEAVSVVQGNQPLVAGSPALNETDPITLKITLPTDTSAVSQWPLTVNLAVTFPNIGTAAKPAVTLTPDEQAAAVGYCTLSTRSVTFQNSNSTARVTIYVNVPTPVVTGNYYWNVRGTNWPSTWSDIGATINAVVLPPIANPTVPPTIVNLLPTSGTSYTYTAPTAVQIPISFTATSATAAAGGGPIQALTAKFDSTVLTLATTGLGATSLGNFSASGNVTHSVTDVGPHTITVSATNVAGTTTATTQINIYIFASPNITNTDNPTFTYGKSGTTFSVTATGWPAPTFTATGLPAWAALDPATGVITGTPTGIGQFTFAITATNSLGTVPHNFTVTVNPAPLTVTAIATSKTYSAPDPVLNYSFSSALFTGDSFTGALSRAAGDNVGTYAINQGNLSAGNNYTISYVSALFTINPATQKITFNPLAPVAVGAAPFALTAAGGASGNPVTFTSSNLAVATVSSSTLTVLSAGTTTITASQAGNTNYSAANPVTQSLTVTAAPTTSTVTILWLEPISLEKVQKGGSVLPIRFLLQECSGHNGIGNDDDGRDDDGSWGHSHGWDDNNGWGDDHGRGNDYSGRNVSCHHGRDGRSTDKRNCRYDSDHDDEDQNGCVNLRDKTVVISIYEIGSNKPATQYKYGTGSPNPPDYVIDGDYQYQLNFPTAKGKHVYHIDVYRFPPGATAPVLVGSKEVTTK